MDQINERKILVAEDEEDLCYIWQQALEDCGAQVTTTLDGAQAWKLFQEKRFDLVISDIRMPKMTGIQLLERIRQQAPDFPVILVSGDMFDGWIATNSNLPKPDDFLKKPLRPLALVEAASQVLAKIKAA